MKNRTLNLLIGIASVLLILLFILYSNFMGKNVVEPKSSVTGQTQNNDIIVENELFSENINNFEENDEYFEADIVIEAPKGDQEIEEAPDFINTPNKRDEYYRNKAKYNGQCIYN